MRLYFRSLLSSCVVFLGPVSHQKLHLALKEEQGQLPWSGACAGVSRLLAATKRKEVSTKAGVPSSAEVITARVTISWTSNPKLGAPPTRLAEYQLPEGNKQWAIT
ncbi:hypothetical protein B0H19DRAFT_1080078 [Mycena capillaripes]|nr:hypothetical protein B0H19DRAFT_1080078 [Mycena capillaripes]